MSGVVDQSGSRFAIDRTEWGQNQFPFLREIPVITRNSRSFAEFPFLCGNGPIC